MTKLFSLFAVTALIGSAATFTGVITESMCLTDHQAMNLGPDAECIRKCVKADKNVKYVLHDGKKAYKLSDQQTPEKFAAQRVKVTGTLYEKTGIIKVDRIEAAR
jgi:hypothetical protein